jgi:DNA-binding NtrC family response regulator
MGDDARRILIIDDDAIVAESIAQYLAQIGYRTDFCMDGESALVMLADAESNGGASAGTLPQPFAVVIVDMSMPGMSGLDFIKAMRAKHPDVVPIVITGYGTIEAAVKSIRQGAILKFGR